VTPPDTCIRRIEGGVLTLNAATQTFSYGYVIRDCRGLIQSDHTDERGLYVQTGTTIDFRIPDPGTADFVHTSGEIRSDRIVVTSGGSRLEFLRQGG
jgi:hypothetical protein